MVQPRCSLWGVRMCGATADSQRACTPLAAAQMCGGGCTRRRAAPTREWCDKQQALWPHIIVQHAGLISSESAYKAQWHSSEPCCGSSQHLQGVEREDQRPRLQPGMQALRCTGAPDLVHYLHKLPICVWSSPAAPADDPQTHQPVPTNGCGCCALCCRACASTMCWPAPACWTGWCRVRC